MSLAEKDLINYVTEQRQVQDTPIDSYRLFGVYSSTGSCNGCLVYQGPRGGLIYMTSGKEQRVKPNERNSVRELSEEQLNEIAKRDF